jgi:hypothetical protein
VTPGRYELAPGHHPSWTLEVEPGRVRLMVGVGVGPHWETDPQVLRQVVAALGEAVDHLEGERSAPTLAGQLELGLDEGAA